MNATRIHVPELDQYCGSWVVSHHDGSVIGEFYDRSDVERFNAATCRVETAAQYLGRINTAILKGQV